jgi:PleD family two-component response regulator
MHRLRRGRPRSISPLLAGVAAATPSPKAQRILVVEDSDCLRAVAVRTLSAGGYAVAEGRHGEDALRVIEQTAGEPFDLVVTEMARRLARQRPRAAGALHLGGVRSPCQLRCIT